MRKDRGASWFSVSINPLLRKSEKNQPLTQDDMDNLSEEELSSRSRQPHSFEDTPGRIWAPAGTALFVSPDPEINRRVKVANGLNLMHSLIEYKDPNDFVDHEDPVLRSYAKFLLHHVQRDTAAHPIDDSYLESVRKILGEVDHGYEKAALDGLPDKEGIEKHNQALMDTYVEKPAHAAVRRALAAGYSPHQSDAFGNWSRKGVLAHPFPTHTPGTGGAPSGRYTFFPSIHEDFVNAGFEPPPGIGHDPAPTDDTGFFFKSVKRSWFSVAIHTLFRKSETTESRPPGSTDPYTTRLLRLFQHNEERPSVSEEEYSTLSQHLDRHSKFLALHHLVADPVLGPRTEALLHHAAMNPSIWSHNSDGAPPFPTLTPLGQNHMGAFVEQALDPSEERVGRRYMPNRMAQAFAVDHSIFPQWALAAGYGPGRNPEVASRDLSQREPVTASANRLLRAHLDRISIQNGHEPHPMGPDDLSREDENLRNDFRERLPEAASYRRPRGLPEQVNERPAPEMMDEPVMIEHRTVRSISSLRNSLLGKGGQ